ncbi:MAG: TIR domain-containing protein [Vicinamibacteraceae bacterium]
MPGIFISYRRNESAGHAGRLFDRLAARFGEDRVFMDVDTLTPSEHFASRIEKAIATADAMLVLIGPHWVAQADRLAQPNDFVRCEILAAMRVECRLIPVTLDGAALPDPALLPEDLRKLLASEGAVLRHGEFARDADHIADTLARFVRPSTEATRRGFSVALARSGWPLSWLSGLARRLSPRATLLAVAAPIAVAWVLSVVAAHRYGQQEEPDVLAQLQVSDNTAKATAGFLSGTVTDDTDHTIEDATVTLSNLDTQLNTATTTDSAGEFTIPYEAVGATSKSRLELAVNKPRFKKFREIFVGNALRYRRTLRPETEVAHAP